MSTLWLWVLRVFLIISGLLGAAVTIYFIVAHVQLNRAIAETDALDPGWRIADIEAARAKIPDDENSALVINKGYGLIAKDAWWDKDETLDKFESHPSHRLTTQQVAAIKQFNDKQAATMHEFRKLASMPRGRFPLTFQADITKSLPEHSMRTRAAVTALRFDLNGCLEANDVAGAVDRLVACINAGRAIGDESFMISSLVRIAVDATTLSAFERFLGQCEADEGTLAKLQAELEKVESEPIFYWGLRGERGYNFAAFEYIKTNSGRAKEIEPNQSLSQYILCHLNLFNRSQAALLRHMNRLVVMSRTAPETWQENIESLDRDAKGLPMFADLFAGGLTKIVYAAQRNYASMRCMITALAAERYRLKHGQWPTKLDDLVTDKLLTKMPIDPYDGKPLRWKEVPTGRIVYSVYRGGIDNGGELSRRKALDETSDIGYELFDPAKRRQPPPG